MLNLSQKGSSSIILIFILVIGLLSAVGYYLYSSSKSPAAQLEKLAKERSILPVPSPIPELTGLENFYDSTESANLKVYRNPKKGYEFVFPREWSYMASPYETYLASDDSFFSGNSPKEGFKTTFIGVEEFPELKDLSQKEALKLEAGREALPLIEEKFLTINGVPAYRALRQIKVGTKLPPRDGVEVVWDVTTTDVEYTFLKNGKLYRLWFELNSNNPQSYINQFDQVAKTFKITN